ncbi:MAG TPA: glycoside hydrolase family 31 protein [Acidobacteriaceae bacterium]|nr:glycoside hydrolase family 31 protein [Acidobacteriaceae bacterium]
MWQLSPRQTPALRVAVFASIVLSALASVAQDAVTVLHGPAVPTPLANGIQVRTSDALMQVEALSDSVLRVRIARGSTLPEDASWAVLPNARHGMAKVQQQVTSGTAGFTTSAVCVTVDLSTLQMKVTNLAGNVLQQDDPAWPVEFHGSSFRIYKAMPSDEHYFGLGDKPGPLDRRGHSFSMWNTDSYAFQESTDEIYKTIPFFMTFREGRAAGTLFDNTFRSSFDFGQSNPALYSFGAADGPIDYYVLAGPTPKDVLREYAWLTGLPPLPPRWAFGYQQSRSSYFPQARVEQIATKLRADHIPADVLYLDIDYQKDLRPFTVDQERFPDFAKMIADLKHQEFHVVAITDPHVAAVSDGSYKPYQSGVAGDHFIRNADGSLYVGNVWPGPSVFPEFTRASTRQWWGTLYENLVHDGVAGFWNDMNEPAVFVPGKTMPPAVQHRIDEPGFASRTATHAEIHNVYGMLNSRATFEGLLTLRPDERPFVLTRATYAGGQRYAWTWTGDNTSTWNHLRMTTPMLLNLGLSGFSLSGADVGGFDGVPGPALLTKWFEIGAFQPLFREHSSRQSGNREPWMDGPVEEAARRHSIEERYRLMPYLYTAAEELSRTGVPIMRPLFVEFPHANADGHPIDLDAGGEFLFGPQLLVAPPPYPEQMASYDVTLPPGRWFDYWTGRPVKFSASTRVAKPGTKPKPAKVLTVQPADSLLPVYVRAGAVIPIAPLTESTMERPAGSLTLRVYPGQDCHGSVYVDDGTSLSYRNGDFAREEFHCDVTAHSVVLYIGKREGTYPVWWSRMAVEIYGMERAPQSVRVNGATAATKVTFDSATQSVHAEFADDGSEQKIEFSR